MLQSIIYLLELGMRLGVGCDSCNDFAIPQSHSIIHTQKQLAYMGTGQGYIISLKRKLITINQIDIDRQKQYVTRRRDRKKETISFHAPFKGGHADETVDSFPHRLDFCLNYFIVSPLTGCSQSVNKRFMRFCTKTNSVMNNSGARLFFWSANLNVKHKWSNFGYFPFDEAVILQTGFVFFAVCRCTTVRQPRLTRNTQTIIRNYLLIDFRALHWWNKEKTINV